MTHCVPQSNLRHITYQIPNSTDKKDNNNNIDDGNNNKNVCPSLDHQFGSHKSFSVGQM